MENLNYNDLFDSYSYLLKKMTELERKVSILEDRVDESESNSSNILYKNSRNLIRNELPDTINVSGDQYYVNNRMPSNLTLGDEFVRNVAIPSGAVSTRQRSIIEMESKLVENGISGKIVGNGNRGKNRIHFNDGEKKSYIYLSTSKNYSPLEDNFSSWHTISPEDICGDDYDFFILSAEDESETPQYFIFTRNQMRDFVRQKTTDSRPYYHFYISRDEEGNYVDSRKDSTSSSQIVTEFYDNWAVLSNA